MPTLQVTVCSCEGLKGKDLCSEADPYVLLVYGKQKHRTRTMKDAGANPEFHETLVFDVNETGPFTLDLRVFDDDLILDTLMGQCIVNFEKAVKVGPYFNNFDLEDKRKRPAGQIKLAFKFSRPDA